MMRNLDKSISINGLTLKNRLVMPPMATSSANDGEYFILALENWINAI